LSYTSKDAPVKARRSGILNTPDENRHWKIFHFPSPYYNRKKAIFKAF